ncbi:MAG: hypothetical protein GWO16_06560 [Gammaproteobacteria bacterium]|nr:hypothetical protein [Gammaproteobacteria bacterium]NIX10702.1 hypothetical protein [Gammaproteobacteria bacterium]
MQSFHVPLPVGWLRRVVVGWLLLGLAALGVSTLFAPLLVFSRVPWVRDHLPWPDLFATSLVLHVDLAVLVWFLAIAGAWWALMGGGHMRLIARSALLLATLGTLVLVAVPLTLTESAAVVMSNYVPVIQTPMFFAGLGAFGSGCALMAARSLVARGRGRAQCAVLQRAGVCAAAAMIAALLTFVRDSLAFGSHGVSDFEDLFWGGGHLLQFAHTLLMLATWLVLATAAGARMERSSNFLKVSITLVAAPLVLVPLIWLLGEPGSSAYRAAFTALMRWGTWPAAVLVALGVLRGLWRCGTWGGASSPIALLTVCSLLLFSVGLLAGGLIHADNLMVTAHYHGTVGAVTLAYMGLVYHLVERLGLGAVPTSAVRAQVRLYTVGLLCLIGGLAWASAHGAERKLAGVAQAADRGSEWVGALMTGVGGSAALLATWFFLGLILRALWPRRQVLAREPVQGGSP